MEVKVERMHKESIFGDAYVVTFRPEAGVGIPSKDWDGDPLEPGEGPVGMRLEAKRIPEKEDKT